MIMPCEVAVKSVVPAVRALVAKELTHTYKLNQTDVASLLGVTQTAVSKYLGHVRGSVIDLENVEEIQLAVKEIADSLTNGNMSRSELLGNVCRVCRIARKKGLMCELCKRSDSLIDVESCSFCLDGSSL
jgi:hypothetical protein